MRWRWGPQLARHADGEAEHAPVIPKYKHRKSTSVIAALFAVGIVTGFTVAETADHSSGPGPATFNHQAKRTTRHDVVTPPTTPTTVAPTTTTVPSPPPTVAANATSVAQPPICTPGEVAISTYSSSTAYPLGSPIEVTTSFRSLNGPCYIAPVPSGPYACGTSVVVNGPSGGQVWPMPGQAEDCAQPSAGVLRPGYSDTVTVAWNQQYSDPSSGAETQAPAGYYQAIGTWSWSAGAGAAPYTVTAASPQFSVG